MKKYFQGITIFCVVTCFVLTWADYSTAEEPYVFGYQADITGVARASYSPIAEGFRAYVEGLNERGGVNGHPIKVIYEDDKSEASVSGAVAQKLITRDNILALIGLGFTGSQPPALELARKSGVGVFVSYAVTDPLFPPNPAKNVFSVGVQMNPKAMPQGYGNAVVCSKIKPGGRIALTTHDTPGGRLVNDWGQKWCEKLGMKVVYRDEWPADTQNFTSWLVKIAKEKPDIMTSTVGGGSFIPLIKQMEKFGLEKVDLVVVDFVNEGDLVKGIKQLSIGNGENVIWLSRYASALDPNRSPEFAEIDKGLKKYGHEYALSGLHAMGWTMGRVVEDALKKAGWPCTRPDFIAAMEKVDIDSKGLTGGPIRFSTTDHYGSSWWTAYRWDAKLKGLKTVVDWYKLELPDIMDK